MNDSKRKILTIYLQPTFLVCVATLAIAGVGMSIAISKFGMYLQKEPLPLKKNLDLLDENGIGTFRITQKRKIENQEIVEALGTEDYIQWVMEDTAQPVDSPSNRFLLFITYYPLPDRVPHVPEECYTGGGYQKMSSESVTFAIDNDKMQADIPGKQLIFANTNAEHIVMNHQFPVLYFFKVNGIYANSREDARVTLNKNIFDRSSYFCKVEMIFNQKPVSPDKEEAVKTCQKLLSMILPVLEEEHWPDWKKTDK